MNYAAAVDENTAGEVVLDSEKRLVSVAKDEKYGISVVLVRDMEFLNQNMKMLIL